METFLVEFTRVNIAMFITGVRVLPILAFGDSLTNGFHADDLSHTPYGNTLEFLLNKDQHRCYTVTTVAKDGTEASEMSSRLQDHLKRGTELLKNDHHCVNVYYINTHNNTQSTCHLD